MKGSYAVLKTGSWKKQPPATVFGLIKQQQHLMMSPQYREITIGFYPHVFQELIAESMSALSSEVTTDLLDLVGRRRAEQLLAGLSLATSDQELIKSIEKFLHSQLNAQKKDARLYAAHELISSSLIHSVNALCNDLNLSASRLRELYRDKVGFTPKEAIRIARIKKALERSIDSEERLTDLAYDLGYFDQSHFIHDFQSLIGLTPKQYFKNPNLTSDFYNYSRLQLSSFVS
ncbi:MAG TPA: helix-turn-helix transcriptional regulator [Candidatus Kapabacteria bacterium]|nr:helix-turn-helix transcriptional regulator [Candidatus Kapabacteria bacterium]